VTESPSEAAAEAAEASETGAGERFAALVGAERHTEEHGTIKVFVTRDRWVEAHAALKEHLPFFSWLAGIDWANEVAVGEAPEEEVVERFEVISRLADVTDGQAVTLSTDLPKDDATLDSIVGVFGGAGWHERETHEMFGIDFAGNPDLSNLYLPDGFEGHPLRKDFALLSREVKPWPGTVDVEDMPSTENAEGGDGGGDEDGDA
jgi:NADH-quinone oxidoreductase subunit C